MDGIYLGNTKEVEFIIWILLFVMIFQMQKD
jgi:hypothetical protein